MNARAENPRAASDAESGAPDVAQGRVHFHIVNRVAILTLERPHALNALSHAMVRELAEHVERCRKDPEIVALVLRGSGEKGFCAGGDVRALYALANAGQVEGPTGWRQFFIDEYRLDFALHTFPKPIVALADGITMGGGMGLTQAATLRVATERSKIAMPETRIGFVPDVGATRFLSVMPVELELYVGLTGATLSGADALRCKLADVCVPSDWLRTFEARLEALPADQVRERFSEAFVIPNPTSAMPPAPLDAHLPAIARHFNARFSVDEMAASLATAMSGASSEEARTWLKTTLEALRAYSPTMLHVTREALLRGRSMTLAEAFRMELDIVSHAIAEGDLCEGVRAHLVDKDRAPRWRPATLAEVSPERVRHFMRSPWPPERHPLAELGELAPGHASRLVS
jgi:enoyl-CoA hydratase/carnithine racemase